MTWWHLHASDVDLHVDAGATMSFHVSLDKNLILKGANLFNFIASNVNVRSATATLVEASSDLTFYVESLFTFNLPDVLMEVYYKGVRVGSAPLSAMALDPGYNEIRNQTLFIEKLKEGNTSNEGVLNEFFEQWMAGNDQIVKMKGPVSGVGADGKVYGESVIDGILENNITAVGYGGGNLATGALTTSATQQGWTANGETVRGAYANLQNPLNVPLNLTKLSANATMPETIKYHVDIFWPVITYDCEENLFGHLYLGEGINKSDADQTWVHIEPNEHASFFVLGGPGLDAKAATCPEHGIPLYPFSCCFAAVQTAYACYLNEGIQSDTNSGQLTVDYMPVDFSAEMTMLIDNAFEVNLRYYQEWLPIYFGWQVYGGYTSDLGLSCSSYKFKN